MSRGAHWLGLWLALSACSGPGPIVLHVAPAGTGAACTAAAPCSLVGARDKVRALNGDMQDDILVNLADGTYTLREPFTLRETGTVHDSGTHGHDIVYQAEPGARPILSGGTRITGWTLWDPAKNVFRASVAPGTQARQLYVSGVRATRARGEIAGFHNRLELSTGFAVSDPTLADWARRDQIEIVSEEVWKSNRCAVASITRDGWHNVVAGSTGAGFAFERGTWFDNDRLANAGDGIAYQVGDFDGDGRSDLLLPYLHASGHWHNDVALSDGEKFAWATPADWLTDAGQGAAYHVGDFDRDGKSDLLLAYLDGTGRWRNEVALSSGRGFAPPVLWLSDAGQGAEYHVGDYDGDQRSDLLLAYLDDDGYWHNAVALSTGAGLAFQAQRDWLPDAGQNATYQVGDFNGDLRSDLLFAYQDPAGSWHNQVAVSTGSGFAAPVEWLPGAGQGAAYHVGDYNGDGKSDLLFASQDAGGHSHDQVAVSTGSGFAAPADWLPDAGRGLAIHVGNFLGGPLDRTTDVMFSGPHARIAAQQPCWGDAHSQAPWPGAASEPGAYYNMNVLSWLENALELLDEPGEWYLDREAGFVYYRPRPGEDLATAPVVAATLETLVDGRGEVTSSGTRFLHNLQFRNLTFAFAGWSAPSTGAGYPEMQAGWHGNFTSQTQFDPTPTPGNVTFSAASALRFEGNVFTHLGAVGLNLDSGSHDNAIIGNAFRDISSTAIQIGDVSQASRTATDPARQARDHVIANNSITGAGAEYRSAVGIFVGYAWNTLVAHNEVSDLPYTGISVGWGWGIAPGGAATGCEDSFAGRNLIIGNRIHDVMLALHDGGAIYTIGGQPDSRVTGNFIVGNPSTAGIYHDQGTCYYTDELNVIDDAPQWLSMWHGPSIEFNTLDRNYVDSDVALCANQFGPSAAVCNPGPATCSDPADLSRCSQNTVFGNTATGDAWPPVALDIMSHAGLEPAYRGLASPVCGDATCGAGETPASCPRDCQ